MPLKKKLMLFLFYASILTAINTNVFAQVEETDDTEKTDTVSAVVLPPFPDSIFRFNTRTPVPKRAGLYSALLPGLGQVYNRQYWKLGLIIAASGAVTGFVIYNSNKYMTYQKAYLGRIDSDPNTTDTFSAYQLEDIDLLRKTYRKYLEYTVIAGTVSYLINILDAFTSAHLKSFDMNKNISMRVVPYFDNRRQAGLKISIARK